MKGHQEVTYKTARLANEAGFPIYNNIAKTNFYNRRTASLIYFGRTGKQVGKHLYGCPTQEILSNWLWDKHKIFVEIQISEGFIGYVVDNRDGKKSFHSLYKRGTTEEEKFFTPAEARESLLILAFEKVL